LSKPEREDQLRSSHKELRGEAFEEAGESLILHHFGDDSESTLWVIEVPVLNSGLDDIERGRYDQRGAGASNGRNKVLHPSCFVVVGETIPIFLGGR
jgi:hypothetical protein